MLNSVCLMGRLVADPELRQTPSGVSVCSFRIAVDRTYQPKGQEKQTDFINIVTWRSTAEFVSRYFRKGQLVAVQGSIQTSQYTDRDGNKRTAFDVVADNVFFAEPKRTARPPAPGTIPKSRSTTRGPRPFRTRDPGISRRSWETTTFPSKTRDGRRADRDDFRRPRFGRGHGIILK